MSSGKQVLILYIVFIFNFCRACPSVCVCKWKNGKQTVECDKRELLAIPKGIDPGTQVLNFSCNNLHTLSKERFLRLDLINLQRIYLSQCQISSIDERTFKGLTNLVELDLSGNLLVSIPTETFMDCSSLMKFTINSNPIRVLRKAAFNHLSFLNTLEIEDCEVSHVEEGAFQGLHSLEWLRLSRNKLTTLKDVWTLPKSLRGIELQANLWECDCHIIELHSWLQKFNIPHSMEPICNGPRRLEGRAVRTVLTPELACLPDVSPTTFYLEIGEGKNISLSCHVRAVPEARVSWLFQGRILQNDTVVAPGLHLIYFLEKGVEDKKSELFIYNTNVEDNGTFVCTAENDAGAIHSNFTLRVVIKQEPAVVVVSFTYEYFLILISAIAVFAIITILTAIIYAIKCSTNRNRNNKKSKSKIATLSNSTKDSVLQESGDEYSESLKEGNNLMVVDRNYEMMMLRSASNVNNEVFINTTPMAADYIKSPTSLRRFQLEQNPDLINDTETVERHRDGDVRDQTDRHSYGKAMENAITDFDLHSNSHTHSQIDPATNFGSRGREFYSLPADVHLNPIGLLNTEDTRASFYRTLPHNRASRQSPSTRYSREAEFLPRDLQPASYEHYCPGVRYTADGYQTCTTKTESPTECIPPPLENCKTDSISSYPPQTCCTPPLIVQWPHCLPVSLQKITSETCNKNASKRCVSAQTESESTKFNLQSMKPINKSVLNVKVQEVLTESPDEGYEGESAESNSNPG